MRLWSRNTAFCLLLTALHFDTGVCQDAEKERLAVLPFGTIGLPAAEGLQLRQRFADALAESMRFEIVSLVSMKNRLDEISLKNIDSCNTLPCLAQLGKVLDVEKVVHVSVDQWKERFVIHIRLVRSHDAALLYDERVEYTGGFDNLVSTVVPEQAGKLSTAYLDRKANWYLIAAAIIVGVGLIYWLYSTLTSTSSSEANFPGSPPSPQ